MTVTATDWAALRDGVAPVWARYTDLVVARASGSWLETIAAQVRTVGISPGVAAAAVSLPSSFPGDPADRLIYATAIEGGWPLITKDERLRGHKHPRKVTVW